MSVAFAYFVWFSFVIGGLALVLMFVRKGLGPGRFDNRARLISQIATRLQLPAPAGALALQWQLPSGFEVHAKAAQGLEITLPLSKQIPAGIGIDRPNLEKGRILAQVNLPDPSFSSFLVFGAQSRLLGLLSEPVRAALKAAADTKMHVAIEDGALRVRLRSSQTREVPDAVLRLEAVARVIVLMPEKAVHRLYLQVQSDDLVPLRQLALHSIVQHFDGTKYADLAIQSAREQGLDDDFLKRYSGRNSGGALSLTAGSDEGNVAIVGEAGALSKVDD